MSEHVIAGVDTSTWSIAEREEFRALVSEEQSAAKEIGSVEAERAKPAAVLAQKRKNAERARRDAIDARALKDAEDRYGAELIGTLRTRMGLVVMKPVTKVADKAIQDRYTAAKKDMGEAEADFVWRDMMIEQCAHPDADRLREMLDEIPRLEDQLTSVYGALANGIDERMLGK